MFKVALLLVAAVEGFQLGADHRHQHQHRHQLELHKQMESEFKLSQSIASAFQMAPPKLMTTGFGGKQGKKLTYQGTGGAFLDGHYLNTTREAARDEATGEEAQHYLYMWKEACAYTRWVPSNQFMYANVDYDPATMTLERFGFIGMDKKCFWGSIGVLWKRPLPVEQILPNTTETTYVNPLSPVSDNHRYTIASTKHPNQLLKGGPVDVAIERSRLIFNTSDGSLSEKFMLRKVKDNIFAFEWSGTDTPYFLSNNDLTGDKQLTLIKNDWPSIRDMTDVRWGWFKLHRIEEGIFAIESGRWGGHFIEDLSTADGKTPPALKWTKIDLAKASVNPQFLFKI